MIDHASGVGVAATAEVDLAVVACAAQVESLPSGIPGHLADLAVFLSAAAPGTEKIFRHDWLSFSLECVLMSRHLVRWFLIVCWLFIFTFSWIISALFVFAEPDRRP